MQWTVLYEGVEELEFGERPGTNKTSFLSNALGHSENPHVQGPSKKGHSLVIRNGAKKKCNGENYPYNRDRHAAIESSRALSQLSNESCI